MILRVPLGSPVWMFAAANTILPLHIGGGIAGVVSGSVALAVRKGGRLHQQAGTIFLASMLVMAGIGAAVAPFLPQRPSVVAGLLTFYLVVSGWITAKRRPGALGAIEIGNLALVLSVIATTLLFLRSATHAPAQRLDGEPVGSLYAFLLVGLIAAIGDLKVIWRGGISGGQRLARHLWRMCVALFVAAASFFLGQQKFLPALLRGSPLLFIPTFAPLAVMIFWMLRVRFAKTWRALGSHPIGLPGTV